jgi:hypothetical protein
MKKIFSAIMAVAALAACNKSEVLETPQGAAIAFDNVYVENATKAADLNKDNIQNFGVFGYEQIVQGTQLANSGSGIFAADLTQAILVGNTGFAVFDQNRSEA